MAQLLWPQPQRVAFASPGVGRPLAASFELVASGVGAASPLLAPAISRYRALLESPVSSTQCGSMLDAPLLGLLVHVASNESELSLATDESYTLAIPPGHENATLAAPTVFGAMRGLETFSQLVVAPASSNGAGLRAACAGVTIDDSPRFPHRELLIDTARYYFAPAALRHAIDAMVFSKLNVLHWHMIDGQSYALESARFPALTQVGAFKPHSSGCEDDVCVYSQPDVRGIVQYGLQRGVRVVPEFDTPGHAKSWGAAFPNVTTRGCTLNADLVPINPTRPFALRLVTRVLDEAVGAAGPFQAAVYFIPAEHDSRRSRGTATPVPGRVCAPGGRRGARGVLLAKAGLLRLRGRRRLPRSAQPL